MSELKGRVGQWQLCWKSVPRGRVGEAKVEVVGPNGSARTLEVRWRRDSDGIWLEFPWGVRGYDLRATKDDADERSKLVYDVIERGGSASWSGVSFARASEEAVAQAGAGRKKGVRVRAQMPGKIVRILVKVGQEVAKDQPLVVMEAMKMENEIRAVSSGKVGALKVSEGQAVESGADLLVIDPL